LGSRLANQTGSKAKGVMPMSISLYEFQKEDVKKLARQRAALIGSEMGTGKTHEAIALDMIWWRTG